MISIIDEDYMYEMANAVKADTGLPYDIWLDSAGKSRNTNHNEPRLKVDVDGDHIHVSISKSPKILTPNKSIFKFNEIEQYIIKYYDSLIQHWNGELSDKQILNILGK